MSQIKGRPGSEFGAELIYGKAVVGEEGAEVLDFMTNKPTGERLEPGVEVKLGLAQTGSWNGDGSPTGNMYCYREFETADGRSGFVDQKWLVETEPPVYEDPVLD